MRAETKHAFSNEMLTVGFSVDGMGDDDEDGGWPTEPTTQTLLNHNTRNGGHHTSSRGQRNPRGNNFEFPSRMGYDVGYGGAPSPASYYTYGPGAYNPPPPPGMHYYTTI